MSLLALFVLFSTILFCLLLGLPEDSGEQGMLSQGQKYLDSVSILKIPDRSGGKGRINISFVCMSLHFILNSPN